MQLLGSHSTCGQRRVSEGTRFFERMGKDSGTHDSYNSLTSVLSCGMMMMMMIMMMMIKSVLICNDLYFYLMYL